MNNIFKNKRNWDNKICKRINLNAIMQIFLFVWMWLQSPTNMPTLPQPNMMIHLHWPERVALNIFHNDRWFLRSQQPIKFSLETQKNVSVQFYIIMWWLPAPGHKAWFYGLDKSWFYTRNKMIIRIWYKYENKVKRLI